MKLSEKNFRFPVKKLVRNIFWDTQEGLKFQIRPKIYFIDNIVTDNKKNPIQA